MRARTGFTYLLVLFGVTGGCLSDLGDASGNVIRHILNRDNRNSFILKDYGLDIRGTRVEIKTQTVNDVEEHILEADNNTFNEAEIMLKLDNHPQFKEPIILPIGAPPTEIGRFRVIPEKVEVEYVFAWRRQKADITGAPAGSDTESET
ncbi:hypothetical protein PTTG_27545 [Puccinia triticina 1-1 BBBD Race 1]|uniref:Uncharacterized protein n=1 Tax=Puccinia triticina (isolate 1-1 / race 1 (BBBD)) TaxID=630390 RepID=A0A180GJG4_PUCT1|nr:hypothetical protein PTTG_27545 [Puccinia triticina 1-1 BBBD Race 1]WAR53858.1 hypothetical protein PtB15_3B367 [Puccinia triticina]